MTWDRVCLVPRQPARLRPDPVYPGRGGSGAHRSSTSRGQLLAKPAVLVAQVGDQIPVSLDLSVVTELPEPVAEVAAAHVQQEERGYDPHPDRRRHPERLDPAIPQEGERLSATVLCRKHTGQHKND